MCGIEVQSSRGPPAPYLVSRSRGAKQMYLYLHFYSVRLAVRTLGRAAKYAEPFRSAMAKLDMEHVADRCADDGFESWSTRRRGTRFSLF